MFAMIYSDLICARALEKSDKVLCHITRHEISTILHNYKGMRQLGPMFYLLQAKMSEADLSHACIVPFFNNHKTSDIYS